MSGKNNHPYILLILYFYHSIVSPAVSKLRSKNTTTLSSPIFGDDDEKIAEFLLSDAEQKINLDEVSSWTNPNLSNSNPLQFQPIFNISLRKDPRSKDRRIFIAILLPIGIGGNTGDFKVCVGNRNIIQLTVMWPSGMKSVPELNKMWLKVQYGSEMKEYHLRFQGFCNFFEEYQAQEWDPLDFTAHVTLQFKIKPDFELVLLGWEGTNKLSYL